MAPPNNINIFYFYLMSFFCSFSITATSSWVAQIPLQWWPLLIPILFVLVILSASGSGFLHLNSGTEYILAENAPRDPIHNVEQVTLPPLEHPTADYYSTDGNAGNEDDISAVVTRAGTAEIEIEEILSDEISEDDGEQVEKYDEKTIGSECLKDECERTRITLQMLLLAQAKFERKQEAYRHKKKRKLKRMVALVPSFRHCFL